MSDTNYDLKAAYKTIKIIFIGIIVGPTLFALVALSIVENPASTSFDLQEPLNLALIILALAALPVSNMVSRKIFERVKSDSDNRERMEIFQRGLIIRLASYEAIQLFSIVVFLLSGNLLVLLFAAVALVGIIQNYPSTARIRTSVGIKEIDLV